MKTLSNGKLLSRYSTVPYCLDNEYVPASHQLDWYQSSLTESAKHQLREARNKLVKRELIRTLIYSPQVIVGRQSLVNEEVMVQFALTDDEIGRLERLRASDVRISEAEQAEQETVTRAAATIASEE